MLEALKLPWLFFSFWKTWLFIFFCKMPHKHIVTIVLMCKCSEFLVSSCCYFLLPSTISQWSTLPWLGFLLCWIWEGRPRNFTSLWDLVHQVQNLQRHDWYNCIPKALLWNCGCYWRNRSPAFLCAETWSVKSKQCSKNVFKCFFK